MADKEGKTLRAVIYCRVRCPENLEPGNGKECGSPAAPARKGGDSDSHTESCDICEGVNRA